MLETFRRSLGSYKGKNEDNLRVFEDLSLWPQGARKNAEILNEEEKDMVMLLLKEKQHHLFDSWEPPGTNDDKKHAFFSQVFQLSDGYKAGGLEGYLKQARKLLMAAKDGENPMKGWKPEVPAGVSISPFTEEYSKYEEIGLGELPFCGFVIVAGGLGERLGYSGIKLELPVQQTTGVCYLELYCRQILSIQRYARETVKAAGKDNVLIPLAIMVSDDTEARTLDLLERSSYFGLGREQVVLLKQEKVPALLDNDASMASAGPYAVDSKPHGHGDVHSLMHSSGTAASWLRDGVRWCVFMQDTNGLALNTLAPMLGVSCASRLEVNSLAVPRRAKQAMGAIARLVKQSALTQHSRTVNVEYNQLDPLLRANGFSEGDVNDAATDLSPFPGNTNQLLFMLEPYVAQLAKTKGMMAEFVNPKYADETRSSFKKPTRLESMMQDYPKTLNSSSKVGFTLAPVWLCYSPCKNSAADAVAAVASGVPANCPYTAECDQYHATAELLRGLGVDVARAEQQTFLAVSAVPGPRIVIDPSTAFFVSQFKKVFPTPTNVKISPNSTLIVEGDVVIMSLNLDGALRLAAAPGTRLVVRAAEPNSPCARFVISNKGHCLRAEPDGQGRADTGFLGSLSPASRGKQKSQEVDAIRGYRIAKLAQASIGTSEYGLASSETGAGQPQEFVYTGKNVIPAGMYDADAGDDTCKCRFPTFC